MRIIDLDSPNLEPVFALVYGGSGTGKTDFCGTIAELGRVLVIDIDKGYKTLKFSKRIAPEKWNENITVIGFDKFTDLNDAYQHVLANDPEKWKKAGVPTEVPFDWVVWDSWTELQWHMHIELRKNENLAHKDGTIGFRQNLQIQHWGRLTDLNKLAVESLRDCKKCNQVFVCLDATNQDPDTKQITYGVSIHGRMVVEFPGYFDDVIYTYTDLGGKWHATTKPKNKWIAKTRLGEGKDVENPYARDFFKAAPHFSDRD